MGEEALPSPKNKVKFLCSHGGKILPRPSDGQLKYVAGETRVVAVPRTITFSELKKKLNSLMEGDMVLKYQMMPEDLDTLVSVKTDEDLKHMIDEYDRHASCGSPKFRAFLFPPTPFLINDNHQSATSPSPTHSNPGDHNPMEQRYIDAINGVLRTTSNASMGQPTFTISSGGSSPNSIAPDTFPPPPHETMNQESALYDGICNPSRPFGGSRSSRLQSMQRVHSSPSLSSLGQQQNQPRLYHHHQQQQYSHQMRIPPWMPVSPRIAPSESSQQGRYFYQVGQQRVSGACGGGYSGHVDGWNTSYWNGVFMDADSVPQLSTKPIGAGSSKWNNHWHGLDYR